MSTAPVDRFDKEIAMVKEDVLARYLEPLLRGDRRGCRCIIEETMQSGIPANSVYLHLIWPVMAEVERLARADKITSIQEHLATRINRTIADQLQNKLPRRPARGKKAVVCCAREELQELGAQIIADLFESDGWLVQFLGGGLTNDDIFGYVNEHAPDVLLIYGTAAKQAPDVRRLIDRIRSVNAWPDMRIVVSGGVFNRAEGLWEEIGADGYAATAGDALRVVSDESQMTEPNPKAISRRKRKRASEITEPVNVTV
jgi:methanogenic corrinoid protein MtbC1